jgi:hypothetical protein
MDFTVLPSISFLLLTRNLNFFTPNAGVPSYLFLVFTFTLPSPSGSQHLLLSYFLATLHFFCLPTILLPKEGKRRVGKLSKCLSLYCKLWATVVHSRGTLGTCVVRTRDENCLRGCSLPNKPVADKPPLSKRNTECHPLIHTASQVLYYSLLNTAHIRFTCKRSPKSN